MRYSNVGVSTMNSEEEKFGVIVCSGCHTAKTVDFTQGNETTECHRCGERLDMDRVKIHYRTDSREEASWAVGQLNAKMNDGTLPDKEEDDEDKDPHTKASKKAEVASNEKERLLIICRTLGEEMGEFEIEDVKKVYRKKDRERGGIEKKIKKLEEIYEPKEGVFRVV